MRPLVTLIITTAIDTTTRLLCVREVFEETEEPYVQWVEAAPVARRRNHDGDRASETSGAQHGPQRRPRASAAGIGRVHIGLF